MIRTVNFLAMNKRVKVLVIIPAYNEEHSLYALVKYIVNLKEIHECVVVDDCSIDKTSIVAKKAGATVIKNTINEGTASSIQKGLVYASKKNIDYVITIDADGQHNPKYIHNLINEIKIGFDYVIASRYLKRTDHVTTYIRRLGTKSISILLFLEFKQRITDPTSGFRIMNRKVISFLAHTYPMKFSEPEIILKLIKSNYKVTEIPCQMEKRRYGKSSISSMKALNLMLFITIKLALGKFKKTNIL